LLDEVTALVERPNVLLCQFEREFLAVPSECLILTMKANQKYFPLLDAKGALTNKFLVVSNIRPDDASAIVQGNERVVRPRLADAKFFFDQDRKKTLESRLPMLDKVVYHAKLGSQGERRHRLQFIARQIGERIGGAAVCIPAETAAKLAKADLVTDMVGEFPELQGVMGSLYARQEKLPNDIARAIEDHYKPRFAGDELPRNAVGVAVALADKLETLVGLFSIGERPTGDKDPYALRRHALGVLRLLETTPALTLDIAVKIVLQTPGWPVSFSRDVTASNGALVPVFDILLSFFSDRLEGMLRDQGATSQETAAVIADDKFWRVAEVGKRLAAVRAFAALPEAVPLAAANKRITNILKKSADAPPAANIDPARLVEPAERALHDAILNIAPKADELFNEGEYTASLRELAALKAPVDAFFDSVMVNADDPALRANRLALLARLHQSMNRVADLSKLAT
jgi:glycyl-tRNA synthetase beta chain